MIQFKKKSSVYKLLALALVLPALTSVDANAREAKTYSITTWNGGVCSGGQRNAWDDMADAWYDEITNDGWSFLGFCFGGHCGDAYSRDGRQVNGNFTDSQFADVSIVSWGRDWLHVDEGDAAMVALHGFENGNDYGGRVRIDSAGSGNCNIMRSEMLLGNSDLEFLHLSSCQSMDDNQWTSWWRAFGGQHQVDGFHGLMWIGSGLVGDYEDFADDAFDSTIADAWLDNMYRPNISGNDDQCPVAYAVGRNSADMWNRISTERYDRVLSDPARVGYWGVIYQTGCDPAAETVIGSDTSS